MSDSDNENNKSKDKSEKYSKDDKLTYEFLNTEQKRNK